MVWISTLAYKVILRCKIRFLIADNFQISNHTLSIKLLPHSAVKYGFSCQSFVSEKEI